MIQHIHIKYKGFKVVQILQAQSYNKLANRLRFKVAYKGKAVLTYLVFFLIYSFCFTAFLFLLDWIKDQPLQFRWEYFIVGWIFAIIFPLPHVKFRGYWLPFSFEKYFINQDLVQDLKTLKYVKTTATIIDIQIPSKVFLKPQLHTLALKLDESNEIIIDTAVHLNLLFQNIYFSPSTYTRLYADTTWIGQKVEVCFLPKSKRIVQLMGLPEQDNFQHLSSDFFDQLRPSKMLILKDIPSHFAQELFTIQEIQAVRQENNAGQYELIITSWFHNQFHIPSNSQGFSKLELMLASKIDFIKYRQFKQNSSIQSEKLYQRKFVKIPPLLSKILSVKNQAFL